MPAATAADAATGAGAPGAAVAQATAGVLPTASQLDAYLAAKGSPMAGQGAAFVTSGGAWKVDPRLLIAIAGAESAFGRITCGPFNAWGYGCPNRPYRFASWAEAIDTVARGLRTNYLAEGRTSVGLIGAKYAPIGASNDPTDLNSAWSVNVSGFLLELGGDPSNVDLGGVAGTLPLGVEVDPLVPAYSFQGRDGRAGASVQADERLVAEPDSPARLVIEVTNSGSSTWTQQTVRLRRVDDEARLVSAPYASLAAASVAPKQTARFAVDLAVAGSRSVAATTRWRLEGPGGAFGDELARQVAVSVSPLVVGESTVQAPRTLAVGSRSAVIVKVRNAGSQRWLRDGEGRIVLGIRASSGPSLAVAQWPSRQVPALLLERFVEPGEQGSFAFPIQAQVPGTATLELLPFSGDAWAEGPVVRVSVETAPTAG